MKILTFLFCFAITISYSQKQYNFDYLFEYQVHYYKDTMNIVSHHYSKNGKINKEYYFTNSKNNNYFAVVTEKDSLHYKLFFFDHKGISAVVDYLKSDLNIAEFINIDCNNVQKTTNIYKYKTKYYDIVHLNDTTIYNETFWHYKMISNKPKKKKKQKIGTYFYIIDKSSNFHLPLLTNSTSFEKWKRNKEIPNGILMEKYFINYYGQLSYHQKLMRYKKIDKKIVIPKRCKTIQL